MVNKGEFIFGGVRSSDYDAFLTGENVYGAPVKRVDAVTVPGRNGSLTLGDPYVFNDIDHIYPAFIVSDYNSNVQGLRNALSALHGAQRLADSYHPDEFYMARFEKGMSVNTLPLAVAGTFEVTFVRDPRRFLISGETAVSVASGESLVNPTLFPARPLIRVVGAGVLEIGSMQITITAHNQAYMDIDSEMMDCYCGAVNLNPYVTFSENDYPTLPAGSTGIEYDSGITSVTVTPRWWRV